MSGEAESVITAEPEPRDAQHETEDLRRRGTDHVRQLRLSILEGPDAPRQFASAGDRILVGTHPSAHLVLSDRTVSRFHCELRVVDDVVSVRDLGSRNCTHIDGVEIESARLHDGALVEIGRTRLRVELGPDRVAIPLSEARRFGSLVGGSTAMRAVFAQLERAAESDATVLLFGETGTGKDSAAQEIHARSSRRDKPFLVLDCGAMPPEILESELFGHQKGAFTGAIGTRIGAFEAAQGGTIFLDEVGELDLAVQPKLLRVLENRAIRRVGCNDYQHVDVRVIAASNRDLHAEVNSGRFRADLYYRLGVLEIALPPLRERLDDIPVLVDEILARLSPPAANHSFVRDPEMLRALRAHAWRGNVRELRNYLERCLAFRAPAPLASAANSGDEAVLDAGVPLRAARDRFERWYLQRVLAQEAGNVSAAARSAGLDRIHFYRLLWKHGLR